MAGTLGLPALMAFVYLCTRLWRQRGRPTDRATWSGLAGLGLDALAQDIEDFRHLWVMIGLTDADADKTGGQGTYRSERTVSLCREDE